MDAYCGKTPCLLFKLYSQKFVERKVGDKSWWRLSLYLMLPGETRKKRMTKGKSGVTFAINQDIQGRLVGSYMEKQQTKRAIDQPDKANSRGFQSEQQSVSTSRGAEMPLFSKDRIEQPFKLLNKIQNPTSSPSSSCSLAQKGKFLKALWASFDHKAPYIIHLVQLIIWPAFHIYSHPTHHVLESLKSKWLMGHFLPW